MIGVGANTQIHKERYREESKKRKENSKIYNTTII
jgi:hypothetical protein